MNAETASEPPIRVAARSVIFIVAVSTAALSAIVLAAILLVSNGSGGAPAAAPTGMVRAPTSHAIESRYGIRVTQIGLTADGGMLDMRFVSLDPALAEQLSHGTGVRMQLLVEDGNRLLNSEAMAPHGGGMRAGSTYFTLFRNDGGYLDHGSKVTLLIGTLRLEHMVVL